MQTKLTRHTAILAVDTMSTRLVDNKYTCFNGESKCGVGQSFGD